MGRGNGATITLKDTIDSFLEENNNIQTLINAINTLDILRVPEINIADISDIEVIDSNNENDATLNFTFSNFDFQDLEPEGQDQLKQGLLTFFAGELEIEEDRIRITITNGSAKVNLIFLKEFRDEDEEVEEQETRTREWIQYGNTIQGIQSGDGLVEGRCGTIFECFGGEPQTTKMNGIGNRVAVSFPLHGGGDNPIGQVRVFEFNKVNNDWEQLGNTILGDNDENKFLGSEISFNYDGNVIAVTGNKGNKTTQKFNVRVFELIGNTWTPKGNKLDNGTLLQNNIFYGLTTSLNQDGNRIVISDRFKNNTDAFFAGAIRIYDFVNDDWVLIKEILGDEFGELIGNDLCLNIEGNVIAYGIPKLDTEIFRVKVFSNDGEDWQQMGNVINSNNEFTDLNFGGYISLSQDGQRIAIGGGPLPKQNSNEVGKVRVFELKNNVWVQIGKDIEESEEMGVCKLSSDGNRIVVGNPIHDTSRGIVKVFQYNSETDNWIQLGNTLTGEDENDYMSYTIDMNSDGSRIVIGIPMEDGENNEQENIGASKVYKLITLA